MRLQVYQYLKFQKSGKKVSFLLDLGVNAPLQFVVFGIWAGRSIQHIAAGQALTSDQ